MMKSLPALALALVSLTAMAAPKYYIAADVVRGTEGAQGTTCVSNSVFFPGEQIVWRAIVYDAATQAALSVEEAKKLGIRVTISLESGSSLNMRHGLHPRDPKAPKHDLFWSSSFQIPAASPLGTLKWTIAATDSGGNTGTYTPIGQDAGLSVLTIAKPAAQKTSALDGQGPYSKAKARTRPI